MKAKNSPLIILAAGASSRMKSAKGLLFHKDKTIIEHHIISYQKIFDEKIFVVLGYEIENYRPILESYKNVEILINDNPQRGMFSSIQLGVTSVNADKCFIIPVDNAPVKSEVWNILNNHIQNHDAVISSFNNKKGHPILISKKLIKKIIEIKDPDLQRLDHILKESNCTNIDVLDSNILTSFNTKEEFEKFTQSND